MKKRPNSSVDDESNNLKNW